MPFLGVLHCKSLRALCRNARLHHYEWHISEGDLLVCRLFPLLALVHVFLPCERDDAAAPHGNAALSRASFIAFCSAPAALPRAALFWCCTATLYHAPAALRPRGFARRAPLSALYMWPCTYTYRVTLTRPHPACASFGAAKHVDAGAPRGRAALLRLLGCHARIQRVQVLLEAAPVEIGSSNIVSCQAGISPGYKVHVTLHDKVEQQFLLRFKKYPPDDFSHLSSVVTGSAMPSELIGR